MICKHVRPRKFTGAKLPIGYAPEFRGHSRSTTRTPTKIFGGIASGDGKYQQPKSTNPILSDRITCKFIHNDHFIGCFDHISCWRWTSIRLVAVIASGSWRLLSRSSWLVILSNDLDAPGISITLTADKPTASAQQAHEEGLSLVTETW